MTSTGVLPMIRSRHALPMIAVAFAALSACATMPGGTALQVGKQATIEGDVISVDTSPWAYDGSAVITVATAASGTISVQLPARWNLCKAQPPDDVQALKPEDRVQVTGTVTAPGELVVCEQPQHRLQKVE
jgi:hypothetical protein